VRTLDKKLARDLWRLRTQALTIAALVGCGIASFVAAIAASASMQASRDAFYAHARFGDVFDALKRAPRSVLEPLRDLPGVAAVEGRIVRDFRIALHDTTEPITARFVSLGWRADQRLNATTVRSGRQVEPGTSDEVMVSEAFAEAWGLAPGTELTAVIDERRARLRVVGIAVSPEFAFAAAPRTGLPDPRHFGIVWMDENALAKATGFVGAVNDVTLRLGAGADEPETLRSVDRLLEPYGGLGAIGRADQPSAKLVEQKIVQLGKLARTLPVIFLAIASFLQNVLLSRIVGTQREQIATLKALGYRSRELAVHYLEFAVVISAVGVALGTVLGIWGARAMLRVYAIYFSFPVFIFRFHAIAIAAAAFVAFASGVAGSLVALRRVVAIAPAEAMRPEAPASYRATALDPLYRLLAPVARMVVRDVQRQPARLVLSTTSIALATSIVMAGQVFGDSMHEVLRLQFEVSHREALTLTLDRPRPARALDLIRHIPGVTHVEGERVVPVRLRAEHRSRTTSILGLQPAMDLHVLLDSKRHRLEIPSTGLCLSRTLAEWLELRAGDDVQVEVLESDRRTMRVPVAALVDDLLGLSGYMNASELSHLLDESPRVDTVLTATDPLDIDAVTERMNALPAVAAVSRPALDEALVRAEVADVFTVLSLMLSLFAGAIAVGVVYNNARIALEVRARDLATMRILGFSRAELGGVLLGEQAIQVVLGVPPGLLLGRLFGGLWLGSVDRELLRIPLTILPASYAVAACVVGIAALASALIVRRESDRLDLVAVLKARD